MTGEAEIRRLQRADVLSKFFLGLGTLVLSAAIGFATLAHNRRATELQVQGQADRLALDRHTGAAQILVDQLPTIIRGSEEERGLILEVVGVLDPELPRQIGKRLLARAATPAEEESARQIIASSESAARDLAVRQHLETARKFMGFRAYPAAAREYLKAYDALPADPRLAIRAQAEAARKLYDEGDFAAAAQAFEEAFDEI
jgi:hypothetical protein